jgi:hypothetical protein
MPAIRLGTFESVAKWRSTAGGTSFGEVRVGAENQLTGALRHLFAMAEEHPELRTSAEFQALAQNLESVEESLRNARRRYNSDCGRLQPSDTSIPGKAGGGPAGVAAKAPSRSLLRDRAREPGSAVTKARMTTDGLSRSAAEGSASNSPPRRMLENINLKRKLSREEYKLLALEQHRLYDLEKACWDHGVPT